MRAPVVGDCPGLARVVAVGRTLVGVAVEPAAAAGAGVGSGDGSTIGQLLAGVESSVRRTGATEGGAPCGFELDIEGAGEAETAGDWVTGRSAGADNLIRRLGGRASVWRATDDHCEREADDAANPAETERVPGDAQCHKTLVGPRLGWLDRL